MSRVVAVAITAAALSSAAFAGPPVTVGVKGNEPIVAAAPDGTLYISALQHIYRSTDSGATWTELAGTPLSSTVNLASDSSISVDPGNRLYFTFDYPYAGSTAVCVSDDHGTTFTCNPGVVPGGTDRMWIVAPKINAAYEVTNEALYQTTFLTSTDRGATFVPKAVGTQFLEPQTGPLLQRNCSAFVLQPIKVYGNGPADEEVKFYVYDPAAATTVTTDVRSTGLKLPTALPSAAFGLDTVLYVASEEVNAAGGKQAVVARSFDEGVTWTKLPPIPATTVGTATFTWVAAGAPGHVGVIYYYTPDNGDPGTLTTSTWSTMWAESYNADTATPTWNVSTIENTIHTGAICVAAGCMGAGRFAGDFINAIIDASGAAHLTWMKQEGGTGASSIRYQRIQSAPPSAYLPVPCGLKVASRKSHGSSGTFDVPLPFIGPSGIECRSEEPAGIHHVVFSFTAPVTVSDATVTPSNGQTAEKDGPPVRSADSKEITVNLKNVSNAQTITVTLLSVNDGTNTGDVSVPMGVLLGDVNGSTRVDGNDLTSLRQQSLKPLDDSNFRNDVNCTGRIDGRDGTVVAPEAQALRTLP